MEEALVIRLAGVVGVVGGASVDWFDRPRGTYEALTLTKVSPGREWTMSGPDGLDEPRVQVDCWSRTKEGAAARARAVLAEMEQQRTVGTVTFYPASLELERWPEAEDVDAVITVFRVQMDFMFNFEEASA